MKVSFTCSACQQISKNQIDLTRRYDDYYQVVCLHCGHFHRFGDLFDAKELERKERHRKSNRERNRRNRRPEQLRKAKLRADLAAYEEQLKNEKRKALIERKLERENFCEDVIQLREKYSAEEIAKMLNVTVNQIYTQFTIAKRKMSECKNPAPKGKRQPSPLWKEREKQIIELYPTKTAKQIAEILGLTDKQVQHCIRRLRRKGVALPRKRANCSNYRSN